MAKMLTLYQSVTALFAPLIARRDEKRLVKHGVAPDRRRERQGHATLSRPDGPLVWLNAVSVGESLSVLSLIHAMRTAQPDLSFLLTTTTATAAQAVTARMPENCQHQFAPLDTRAALRRFLDYWHPDLAVFVESEIWPRTIGAVKNRRIPLALVNARLSERSLRRWAKMPGTARRVFGQFDLMLAQTDHTAAALREFCDVPVLVTGDLKSAAPALPVDPAAKTAMQGAIAGRPVWLAASTHEGEETPVAQAHAKAQQTQPDLLLILAPRHPDRGPQIADDLTRARWRTTLRSTGALPNPDTQIYIADTLGELGLWYELTPVAFLGASLVEKGGHNPYEAAHFGTPLLHGPHVFNFADVYARMDAAGATKPVGDDFGDDLIAALQNPAMSTEMASFPIGPDDLPDQVAAHLLGLLRTG